MLGAVTEQYVNADERDSTTAIIENTSRTRTDHAALLFVPLVGERRGLDWCRFQRRDFQNTNGIDSMNQPSEKDQLQLNERGG